MNRLLLLCLLLCALPCAASPAVRYRITPLPGLYVEDEGAHINNKGVIISGNTVWKNGNRWTLRPTTSDPLYQNTSASAINDAGSIVGSATGHVDGATIVGFGMAVLWKNGHGHELLAKMRGAVYASGINNLGDVVGNTVSGGVNGDQTTTSYLLSHKHITYLGDGTPTCINNKRQVLLDSQWGDGSDATKTVIWEHGRRVPLTFPHSYYNYKATGMNDKGEVVGRMETPKEIITYYGGEYVGHAFLWHANKFRDLGTLGKKSSLASSINNRGQIVGNYETDKLNQDKEAITRAFVWQNRRMTDLNTLIPKHSSWVLTEADAINDRGQIVCAGNKGACLLTPITAKRRRR